MSASYVRKYKVYHATYDIIIIIHIEKPKIENIHKT